MQECNHCGNLKESDIKFLVLNFFENLIQVISNFFHRNHLPINLDPLPERRYVRWYKQSRLKAQRLEHVCALERYRPFAIGTRNVDALERVVRVVENLAQVAHMREVQRNFRRLGGS